MLFDCVGCRHMRAATGLSHTRNTEPPGLCRYLHVDPIDYSCPACRTHKRAEHPDHTNVEGECRAPVIRRTAGRRRTQGNSREPAIRGAGDGSDRRRLTADDELEYPPPPRPAELQAQEEEGGGNPGGNPGGAASSSRGTRAQRSDTGQERSRKTDVSVQAGGGAAEDLRTFDVTRSMTALRSDHPEVRKRTLQRLHVRWYHATIDQMTAILRAAGVPPRALADIPGVVHSCGICRQWHKPSPKNITAFRMVDRFNEEVQFDLMFYHEGGVLVNIIHLIDVCIRWSATRIVETKEEAELTKAISDMWITIFGPMETLTQDEETGMRGQHASEWAASNEIGLKFAPRHRKILRDGRHLTETQLEKESIKAPLSVVLAQVNFYEECFHHH